MRVSLCKSSSYRITLLFCFLVAWAAPMPDVPRALSASGAPGLFQATNPSTNSGLSKALQGVQINDQQNPISEKQKRGMVKANFEKMKHDARELAELAQGLEDELDKSNENILSLNVVDKADKIEKLARKIKGTARGY